VGMGTPGVLLNIVAPGGIFLLFWL
jgi:hypothetical protein